VAPFSSHGRHNNNSEYINTINHLIDGGHNNNSD